MSSAYEVHVTNCKCMYTKLAPDSIVLHEHFLHLTELGCQELSSTLILYIVSILLVFKSTIGPLVNILVIFCIYSAKQQQLNKQ